MPPDLHVQARTRIVAAFFFMLCIILFWFVDPDVRLQPSAVLF
jgi:hypothetical protein